MAIIRRTNQKNETRYQVKLRDGLGKWLPSETFRTKAEALAYQRQLLTQKDQGTLMALPASQRNLTVGEYWTLWANQCRGAVSDGWKISQNQMARDYVLPNLAKRRLFDVRPQDIGLALEESRRTGLSPQTLKHVYSLLHKLFEDAVEHYGWLGRNPVLGRYRPKVPRRERDFLSPSESQTLLEFSRGHYLGPAIWLQLLSGLRPSEVQALRWGAIDWDRGQILIRAAFNNKEARLQEHPKQEDWGMAPMPPTLRDYLTELRGRGGEGFVANNVSGKMLPYETYLRALRRVCTQAGVRPVTPHELRHSCTELYIQAGASAEDIRRLLNQSSLTATARYMHRTDERLSSIASNVPQMFPAEKNGDETKLK